MQLLEQLEGFFKNLQIESKNCLECIQKLKNLEYSEPIQTQKTIKRPIGGYTRFLKAYSKETKLPLKQFSKVVAKKWRSMSSLEKQPYMDEFYQEQEQYKQKKVKKINEEERKNDQQKNKKRQTKGKPENELNQQVKEVKKEENNNVILLE